MAKEIERKFLVEDMNLLSEVVEDEGFLPLEIIQIYISDEVRLRVEYFDDKDGFAQEEYFINIKLGKSLMRQEYEYKIPKEDGKFFICDLQEAKKNHIDKTRCLFEYKNQTFELDIFKYKNDGLAILEIELDNESDKFELPPGIGKEVTDDERYYNSSLAKNPYKNWSKK